MHVYVCIHTHTHIYCIYAPKCLYLLDASSHGHILGEGHHGFVFVLEMVAEGAIFVVFRGAFICVVTYVYVYLCVYICIRMYVKYVRVYSIYIYIYIYIYI
jgi:hypothetical protein